MRITDRSFAVLLTCLVGLLVSPSLRAQSPPDSPAAHEQVLPVQTQVATIREAAAADQTVTLQIRLMELQVTKMRELGLDFRTPELVRPEPTEGNIQFQLGAIRGFITALRQHDLIQVLAEPTLATVSGRAAKFESGGKFPVVVPQSSDSQSVEHVWFGTRVNCLATILDTGRIRLELRCTVSELDTSRSVVIDGTPVPGLRTRSIDTAVEMDAGQTLVLGGMIQSHPRSAGDPTEVEETSLLLTVTANQGVPVDPVPREDTSEPH